jgi:hypothetical protein
MGLDRSRYGSANMGPLLPRMQRTEKNIKRPRGETMPRKGGSHAFKRREQAEKAREEYPDRLSKTGHITQGEVLFLHRSTASKR